MSMYYITYLSVFGVREQQRRIPACASAQSDQRLCVSLIEKYHMLTCYTRNFNLLAILREKISNILWGFTV